MKPLMNPYLATVLLTITAKVAMADRLADPTRPVSAKEIRRDAYDGVRLEAILSAENRLIAIVNGKVVRAGDRIGDTRIDEIYADSIIYTRAGQTKTARLANETLAVRSNVVAGEEQ